MNEEVNSLNELDSNSSPEQSIQPTEPKIDNLGRSYATGRRKDSTARVWVKKRFWCYDSKWQRNANLF